MLRYDYGLQVWTNNGIIEKCEHRTKLITCNACKYAGKSVESVLKIKEVLNTYK